MRLRLLLAVALLLAAGCGARPEAAGSRLILAAVTTTQDSGLLDALVPAFERATGYKVDVIAQATGQVLKQGERGEADVVLEHAPALEKAALQTGAFVDRRLLMHNDFVLLGPAADPAGVRGSPDAAAAFARLGRAQATFASRADESGTHQKEKEMWRKAGVEPVGERYLKAGTGMANTLLLYENKHAYVLDYRATYLTFRNKLSLALLFEGDPVLFNVYHVLRVNPERFRGVNAAGALAFADFVTGGQGQAIIENFGKDKYGQPLYTFDAGKPDTY